MKTTIYKDADRELVVEHGRVHVAGKSAIWPVELCKAVIEPVPPKYKEALIQKGYNPDDWYWLTSRPGSRAGMCLPNITRNSVEQAIADAKAEQEDPATIERKAINKLFAQAQAARDNDLNRHFQLLTEARRRLAAWQAAYPENARKERKEQLLAEAETLKGKAAASLLYDDDGWISEDGRQARHDEFMAKAQEKIEQANNL